MALFQHFLLIPFELQKTQQLDTTIVSFFLGLEPARAFKPVWSKK